ncbi:MAG TPA: formate dehydrogenase, partial [Myxococcales bacterium]|nr:formate dehydrogenase [Myxococcales bacterium]
MDRYGYTNRVVQSWGVDGHNSHTNICSASARVGYYFWAGFDRPSPDYANAKAILLISSHLETGHYFNPHAQRIIEAQQNGAKIITMDPRLSNTASKSDVWLPTWPGSETTILLAIANHLIQNDLYDRDFVKDWVNWADFLQADSSFISTPEARSLLLELQSNGSLEEPDFEDFDRILKLLYAEFTLERASEEASIPL